MNFSLKELSSKEDMLACISVVKELYPSLNESTYADLLDDMLPNNHYTQLAVFDNDTCVGITGFWIGTKLWCGKYLELDNVVVSNEYRSKGVGKLMSAYLEQKANDLNCTILVLDAYTTNFKAHRFYYNQGFAPKGFHFVKVLNSEGIR